MTTLKEKTLTENNEELASIVKRLGSPVSTILLDSPCHIFRMPQIDGIIGYQLVNTCAVIIGDPICLPENAAQLSQAFYIYCQKQNWRIIYALVSNSFAHWAIDHGYRTLIQVGEELIINPTHFQKRQKLRWKINQSHQQGVIIKEYTDCNASLEKQMKDTIKTWLKEKSHSQIYLGTLDTFTSSLNKRIFYAMQNDKIIGLIKIVPLDRFHGWTINSFLALPNAPTGTTEHLISFVCDTLANEQCSFLCLGAISGSQLGEIVGLNFFSKYLAYFIFDIAKWFFQLEAKRNYLNKYRPDLILDYFIFSENLTFKELMAIKQILNVKLCYL